ncbi:MAG TPA: cyclic nucleotide-binding domain-containing protein [Solirubrobacterales bacterium]|nr:cyclic nucleotide-binding domain-containing protein [Solirubrobacterales bacterium]
MARGTRGRRGKDRKVELLRDVPLFSACTGRELKRIASLVDEVDVPEGKVLMRQGKPGTDCFVIAEGTAKASMRGRKSVRLGPGSCVGEMSLLDGNPRSATVTAETPMQILVLGSRAFSRLLDDVPEVGRRIMKALAVRLRDAERPQPQH